MRTALGTRHIAESSRVGAGGVHLPFVDRERLEFAFPGRLVDDLTSRTRTWNPAGQTTLGPLMGKASDPIEHGVYYAFAWLAFKPETEVPELEGR